MCKNSHHVSPYLCVSPDGSSTFAQRAMVHTDTKAVFFPCIYSKRNKACSDFFILACKFLVGIIRIVTNLYASHIISRVYAYFLNLCGSHIRSICIEMNISHKGGFVPFFSYFLTNNTRTFSLTNALCVKRTRSALPPQF